MPAPCRAPVRSSSATEPSTFLAQLADALRRRLHPHTALHVKQLAHALGCHEDTVRLWLHGRAAPSGAALVALIALLDAGFANEVLAGAGVVVAKLEDARAARAVQLVNRLAPVLHEIEAAKLDEVGTNGHDEGSGADAAARDAASAHDG